MTGNQLSGILLHCVTQTGLLEWVAFLQAAQRDTQRLLEAADLQSGGQDECPCMLAAQSVLILFLQLLLTHQGGEHSLRSKKSPLSAETTQRWEVNDKRSWIHKQIQQMCHNDSITFLNSNVFNV